MQTKTLTHIELNNNNNFKRILERGTSCDQREKRVTWRIREGGSHLFLSSLDFPFMPSYILFTAQEPPNSSQFLGSGAQVY